jgi:3-hydroxymyristoyl/3-hydroxydecanoyl-(acyl carrier protein) dehydratase
MTALLPEVLAVRREGDARVVLDLGVPAGLAYFEGHFPGLPVLPGVVQVDWAARLAPGYLPVSGKFTAMENIKFLALVLPDTRLELSLAWDQAKEHLDFAFSNGPRKCSSGRLVFGGGT